MRKTSVKNSVKNGITRPRRVGKRMLPHWEHHGPLGLCAETRSVGYVSMSCAAQLNYEYTSTLGNMERTDSTLSDRRKRARKIIINPFADFAFTAIFFVEARRTECHGAASAMMP